MIETVVRNEEPLPDGWWFIPPAISLEEYVASDDASHSTDTKKQKGKKKRKAETDATNANDTTEPQSDLPQEAVTDAECKENIPLATVAPNLRVAGTVITNLMERFPQEFANFNAKLREFYDANVPKGNSIGLKNDIRRMISDLLSKQIPGSELYIVGSTVNGCGTANSDLDMCLVAEDEDGGHPSDKQFVMDTLSVVKRTLLSDYRKRFWDVKLVPHATVPIITFDVLLAGFVVHVDINVNQLFGIRNSVDKRFSILCVLVRQWAKVKGIGNARCGGLNSYTLNLLVLHYLTFASDPPLLPNLQKMYPDLWNESTKLSPVNKTNLASGFKWKLKNKKSLGELVLGFFDYFAHFDFDAYGISTAEGRPMERGKFPSAMQKYNIIVMDPFEPVNAARTVFKKSHPVVLYAFRCFVLDAFGESVLHPPCDSPTDDGAMETAWEADDGQQEAEDSVKSDRDAAKSHLAEEGHDHGDAHTDGSEMIVHQENGELPNGAGEAETAPKANDDCHEAKHCDQSNRDNAESQAVEESHYPSGVCADGSETIVHQDNGEPPNDSGEVGSSTGANDDLPEAAHCVKSDRDIADAHVAEESRHHSEVRINGSENVVHQENLAANSSAERFPSAADRPKKAGRSRLSKLRKHCWCL